MPLQSQIESTLRQPSFTGMAPDLLPTLLLQTVSWACAKPILPPLQLCKPASLFLLAHIRPQHEAALADMAMHSDARRIHSTWACLLHVRLCALVRPLHPLPSPIPLAAQGGAPGPSPTQSSNISLYSWDGMSLGVNAGTCLQSSTFSYCSRPLSKTPPPTSPPCAARQFQANLTPHNGHVSAGTDNKAHAAMLTSRNTTKQSSCSRLPRRPKLEVGIGLQHPVPSAIASQAPNAVFLAVHA